VGRDGDVHIVQGSSFKLRKGERSSWTVVWVRFDPSGNVVHRVAVPLEYATDEAALDAIGRLYVRGTVEDGRFAIVRINPTRKTAATVAESKTADRLDGFAIDPDGNLRLREKRVKGGGRELEVLSQRSVFGRWARGGLVAGVAAALASIPATLATKKELLTAAANGETITVSHGRGSRSRLGPSDLEALVPALDAQVVESIVFAVGLLVLLLTVGRGTPARAVALGAIWALAVLVISIPLHMVVGMGFARPFEVMAASMAAPGVLLGVGLGLLALGAGRRASFRP
jgi:hypothetical protein